MTRCRLHVLFRGMLAFKVDLRTVWFDQEQSFDHTRLEFIDILMNQS
jgi:hypothetical protein